MNLSDLSNGDKLVCAYSYFARTCCRITSTFMLRSRILILKGCKTKFSADATLRHGKGQGYRRTFEQSRTNKKSSSLHLTALPVHGIYFFLIRRTSPPSQSWLLSPEGRSSHKSPLCTHCQCLFWRLNGSMEREWMWLFCVKATCKF